MAQNRNNGEGERPWKVTKEKILMFAGLAIIFSELVNAEVFGRTFHFEFLLAGLALCGISIAQWGDHKS
jgi:hypothetical protein